MVAAGNTDELLRSAIRQKRLIQRIYKEKRRIVEPHDYGIHRGVVKLLGFQVGGASSNPLPNWRWMEVNFISGVPSAKSHVSRPPLWRGQTPRMGSAVPESRTARGGKGIGGSPAMRQEFIELRNGMRGDAREHIAKPGKRVYFHQFTRTHKASQHCHCAAPAITAQKYPVVPSHRDSA